MEDKETIINDFNRIANLDDSKWGHNEHYHKFLIDNVPDNCQKALDIGCGKGDFTRLLAPKSQLVLGLDMSPEMIKKAVEQSKGYKNIVYKNDDVLAYNFGKNEFDYIVSIATLHHLPLKEFLVNIRDSLRPNGVLAIIDLYKAETLSDYITSAIAVPLNILMTIIKTGKLRKSKQEIEIWDEHGKHDFYLTLEEIKTISSEVLPGAKLKRHLFWRYSLIWRREP